MKVLVIGSGGREHCLVWKLSQSPLIDRLFVAPGNAGTETIASNVAIAATDIDGLLKFAHENKINFTVVGPEAPLVEGIVDVFEEAGLKIFGPRKEFAQLEGSKVFAKLIMKRFGIPTAGFEVFDHADKAKEYIRTKGVPLVIKADGLAAGKGVVVVSTIPEAEEAVDLMMRDRKFGSAGDRIVIEDCLKGQEASILVFVDGENAIPLVSSQDHKAIFEDDRGPNTGGMGAYAPAPLVNDTVMNQVGERILNPLIAGLRSEHKLYRGILYVGLMIENNNPSVLEFNVRFGDPETQVILPKLKSDLLELMIKTTEGKLAQVTLDWDERPCICVVLASGGYPGQYEKGKEIKGLEKIENVRDVYAFHAGTKIDKRLVTNGGRVLNITGLGQTLREAQEKTYNAIENISFEKMYYRKDIANKAL